MLKGFLIASTRSKLIKTKVAIFTNPDKAPKNA